MIKPSVPWIASNEPLPPPERALSQPPEYNGLLAAGRDLTKERLLEAYQKGVFPWYPCNSPAVLWWSPNPRTVLHIDQFIVQRSLRQTIKKWHRSGDWQISINRDFERVLLACGSERREGTWIDKRIHESYLGLHKIGFAHSVEVWRKAASEAGESQQLCAGLYGVAIGRMFFGESMFTRETDASKIALLSLVNALRTCGFEMIDCQVVSAHLLSLGATAIPREIFLRRLSELSQLEGPNWGSLPISLPKSRPPTKIS